MTNELFQKIINEASDKDLVEAGIGCNNHGIDNTFAHCKYSDGIRCLKGAFLTSTLGGAHPKDCPLYKAGEQNG